MEISKRIELVKERIKNIEGYEKGLQRSLTRLELRLFREFTKRVIARLDLDGRDIKYNFKNLNVAQAVNKVVDLIEKEGIKNVANGYIDDIANLFKNVDAQYKPFANQNVAKKIITKQNNALSKSLGIVSGKIDKGGFLDEVFDLTPIKVQLKQELFKAVAGQTDISTFKKNLKDIIVSKDGSFGTLNKKVFNQLNDTYAQVDRAKQQFYAEDLGLQAFIYFGTEIKATRNFCSDRIGKTFLKAEFIKDAKSAGNFQGKPKNYNPLVDLGGYNCRHSLLYITNAEALRRRKDLEEIGGKLKIKK